MSAPIQKQKEINQIDVVAIWISLTCLAHCLLMPIVFSLLPFLGDLDKNDWIHKTLIVIALPVSVYALWRSGGWQVMYLVTFAILGLIALGVAAFVPAFHDYETGLSVFGALVLAVVHYKNSRLHQCKANNCTH